MLAQFRAFVRQVPESDVGKRCAALVDVFRASQKRSEFKVPYALWVNPQGLFMRVQVKSIVDALSSPRVKVHIRLDEHALAKYSAMMLIFSIRHFPMYLFRHDRLLWLTG